MKEVKAAGSNAGFLIDWAMAPSWAGNLFRYGLFDDTGIMMAIDLLR